MFERNERFWGKKPLLHRIEYLLDSDVNVLWQDFAQGKGDVGLVPAAALAAAHGDERRHCTANTVAHLLVHSAQLAASPPSTMRACARRSRSPSTGTASFLKPHAHFASRRSISCQRGCQVTILTLRMW